MISRLIGALIRACALVFVIAAPAFLLPNVSVAAQEITLIVAGIAAAFTLFEYASTHPGLIDFRFAPPYNRIRYTVFAVQVLSAIFICRASAGQDSFSPDLLRWADQATLALDFPLSPVAIGSDLIASDRTLSLQILVERVAAISFLVTYLPLAVFGMFLWVVGWPVRRKDFNLWINLPTFEPGYGRDVERRLKRDGFANLGLGIVTLYVIPFLLGRSIDWFESSAVINYQPVVWGATIWMFLSGSLFIRGMAILKVSYLVRRTRRA